MTIEELDEFLFLGSNQFFLGYENIEVKRPVLDGIVKKALMYYGNYKPFVYKKTGFEIKQQNYQMKIKEIDGRKIQNIRNFFILNPAFNIEPFPSTSWEYNTRTHTLWTMVGGTFSVDFIVRPILEDITFEDEYFLEMCQGLYLMYIGGARKAFTLDGLPFGNDASELYSDGKEMFENALENLKEENSSWWEAIVI